MLYSFLVQVNSWGNQLWELVHASPLFLGLDWAMSRLGIGLTANQNSIPRELVYDVDAMLSDNLDSVPFPFIGSCAGGAPRAERRRHESVVSWQN